METFWQDVPELVGRRIETVRFTSLATVLGGSLVVVGCTDGTLVRIKCTDLGCELAEVIPGTGEDDEEDEDDEDSPDPLAGRT